VRSADSILLGDIGGTNSRFALAGSNGRPQRIVIVEDDSVTDLASGIARYLRETAARPSAAVLAVAAPVSGEEEITLTNRGWRFRRSALAKRFGFTTLRIINDFEAIAWAIPRLDGDDARPLGPELEPGKGVRIALGPGTGLGVAALVPTNGRLSVVGSEGGHASIGPQSADEFPIFARLLEQHGSVCAETILSGPGLVRLIRAVDPQSSHGEPETVVAAAQAGDPSARETLALFVRILGRFAGDLALTFKALGGVYIAGGVASRFGPLLDETSFRTAFEGHPPYQELLGSIPTLLMGRTEPGLLGCNVLADELANSESK
jgi:glucokinase